MIRLCVLVLLGLVATRALAAEQASRLSVLIVDGMNNHDWPRATRTLKGILESSDLFTVDVSTSPTADAPKKAWDEWRPQFAKYDVVVSNFNGGHQPASLHWPREIEQALEDRVRSGGGLVIYHSANNSFPNWPAFNEMIGLGWRGPEFGPSLVVGPDEEVIEIPKGRGRSPGHGPEHDFLVARRNTDHPIIKGLPLKWLHPHEQLTHGQHGPAKDMTILTYALSKDTGDNEVLEWVIPYGQGRVYVTMLGHLWKEKPDTAMRCIGFQTTLIRGCEWAATGRVTSPVPEDFPTATDITLRAEATTQKPEDRVSEIIRDDGTIFSLRSPSGIGSATIHRESWPSRVTLRLHLRGLEGLAISSDTMALRASVLSRGGHRRLLRVMDDGREDDTEAGSRYRTDIGAFDSNGRPVRGSAGETSYFEMLLPQALFEAKPKSLTLEAKPKSLTIEWIDFYRQ